jgi:elongation factor Tu
VIAQPGTVKTYKKFQAEVYILNQSEGGRHTPFFSHYRWVVEGSLMGC